MSTVRLPTGLQPFRERLTAGVLPTARATRPANWAERDTEAITADAVLSLLAPMLGPPRSLECRVNADPATVEAALHGIRLRRNQLLTLLFSPDHVLETLTAAMVGEGDPARPARLWSWMCWFTEVAHHQVGRDSGGEAYLLRPLVDRLRFLVMSEPLRHRLDPTWTPAPNAEAPDYCGNALGQQSWPLLVRQAEEARRDWLARLNAYQSSPLLAGVTTEELDAELLLILGDTGTTRDRFSSTHRTLDEAASPTVRDDAVLAAVLRTHFLPRFRLLYVARLASPAGHDCWRTAILTIVAASVAAAVTGGFTAGRWFHASAMLATVAYAMLIAGVVKNGPVWATQWLLRFPAAAAFGLFGLLTLPMNWWSDPHPKWAVAPAALVLAAASYLVIEVRNHGVRGLQALKRAGGVLAVGAVHAFLLSLIVLVAVAATYTESVPGDGRSPFTELWNTTGLAWQTLTLATAWALAIGVFSQILWDDRPITAPLAHLTWHDGG
ncbi:hypothetical protein [Streptomyces sp. NPDC003393]